MNKTGFYCQAASPDSLEVEYKQEPTSLRKSACNVLTPFSNGQGEEKNIFGTASKDSA